MQKIMFNDKYGLTKAVLEGRKTQTRRIIPKEFFTLQWDVRDDTLVVENECGDFIDIRNTKFCMFKKEEIVAVAQSYKDCGGFMEDGTPRWDYISCIVGNKNAGWSNKMFVKPELMPHQIRMKNVRIERLQDISDEDCLAEGIEFDAKAKSFYCGMNVLNNSKIWLGCTPREAYAALIDKVGKKGDWKRNPYVFVDEFKLIK
ncbi:hypothetical protein [Phocaeicola coprophilus]|uniref:hypothetical protein n=1 Tax=Phocaeicola coprophilus TaxID=387090 RepID=UPI0039F6151C